MRILKILILLFITALTYADTEAFISVIIMDRESDIRHVFEHPGELNKFKNLWENRTLVSNMKEIRYWDYQIDVITEGKSTRWLYDSRTGLCSVLSKDDMPPVLLIEKFDVLNEFIAAEPAENMVWVVEERPVFYFYESSPFLYDYHTNHYYDNYHHHMKNKGYHHKHYDVSRDSKHERRERQNDEKSEKDTYTDTSSHDHNRWGSAPVYTSNDKKENNREYKTRQTEVQESKSRPLITTTIDDRMLPGVRRVHRD